MLTPNRLILVFLKIKRNHPNAQDNATTFFLLITKKSQGKVKSVNFTREYKKLIKMKVNLKLLNRLKCRYEIGLFIRESN